MTAKCRVPPAKSQGGPSKLASPGVKAYDSQPSRRAHDGYDTTWVMVSVGSYRRGFLTRRSFFRSMRHGRDFVLGLLQRGAVDGLGGRGCHEPTGILTITQTNKTWQLGWISPQVQGKGWSLWIGGSRKSDNEGAPITVRIATLASYQPLDRHSAPATTGILLYRITPIRQS